MKTTKFAFVMAVALTATGVASAQEHLKSLDPKNFDNTVPAGTDFYQHVTKGWQKAHPLTAEYARYGQFNVLSDSSEQRVKDIVLNLGSSNPEPGSVAFKVSTIYNLVF